MLSIKNLKFSYGDHEVLRGLSAEIKSGAVTTLMGAIDIRIATLLSLLTKNLKPAEGSILLDGQNLAGISLKDFARRAAIVHQKNAAPNDLTVEKLVSYGRLPYSSIFRAGLDEKNQAQVERAMALTGLLPLKDRRIGTLSGGQRQRAFIAMALAQDTKLLFLDEPTTSLDVRYQVEILRLVERLNREQGITIVMVLHDINQALAYSDEVIGLKDGRVAVQGAPEDVIDSDSLQTLYGIRLPVFHAEGRLCVMAV